MKAAPRASGSRPTIYRPLPRRFFARNTVQVARALLGQFLVHETRLGRVVGRIVETEAYRGPLDPASHAYRRTARSEVMYGEPGVAYIYFSYGMHYCMNVVTEGRGRAGAVLLRAVEVVERADSAGSGQHGRAGPRAGSIPSRLAAGPGRVTAAMRVGPAHNGADLTRPPLYLARGDRPAGRIVTGPRVGISLAQTRPWRFGIAGHPSLSRPFRAPL